MNGIIVTLTDTRYSKINAYDITMLLNELREAGAEAISINEQRIVYDSYIANINGTNYITINGERVVAPYTIKAIGNTTYLESSVAQKNYGFIDTQISEGKQVTLERGTSIIIPAYNRSLDFEYVKEEG